jgi:hypothetical protein
VLPNQGLWGLAALGTSIACYCLPAVQRAPEHVRHCNWSLKWCQLLGSIGITRASCTYARMTLVCRSTRKQVPGCALTSYKRSRWLPMHSLLSFLSMKPFNSGGCTFGMLPDCRHNGRPAAQPQVWLLSHKGSAHATQVQVARRVTAMYDRAACQGAICSAATSEVP